MPTSNETRVRVRRLLEDHRQCAAGQQPVCDAAALQRFQVICQVEQLDQLVVVELVDRKQIVSGKAGR